MRPERLELPTFDLESDALPLRHSPLSRRCKDMLQYVQHVSSESHGMHSSQMCNKASLISRRLPIPFHPSILSTHTVHPSILSVHLHIYLPSYLSFDPSIYLTIYFHTTLQSSGCMWIEDSRKNSLQSKEGVQRVPTTRSIEKPPKPRRF